MTRRSQRQVPDVKCPDGPSAATPSTSARLLLSEQYCRAKAGITLVNWLAYSYQGIRISGFSVSSRYPDSLWEVGPHVSGKSCYQGFVAKSIRKDVLSGKVDVRKLSGNTCYQEVCGWRSCLDFQRHACSFPIVQLSR